MINFIILYVNVVSSFIGTYFLMLYPMWKTRDIKASSVFAIIACLTVIQSIVLLFARQRWNMEISTINVFITIVGLPTSAVFPFFIYRKRPWQNIFLLSICFAYHLTPSGISNYAHDVIFASHTQPLLAAGVFKIVLTIATLPFVLYVLRRLFENTQIEKTVVFWRFFWLVPGLFFAITMMSNNYLFFPLDKDVPFVVMRLLVLAALLIACYLLETSVRQAMEAESEKRKTEELADKNQFLESLSKMKSEYLSNLSHEMKTPLTVLSLNLQRASRLSASGGDREKIEKAHAIACGETERMIRMTDAALSLASMQESKSRMSEIDISELLANCAEAYMPLLEKNGNDLKLNIQENLPLIEGVPDLLTQVFSNLLSNANAHTKDGEIVVEAATVSEVMKIVVRDNGEGVDSAILFRVFERGVSGRGSSGLGLSLCKDVVESHGGLIGIENGEEIGGAVVTITLPVYKN